MSNAAKLQAIIAAGSSRYPKISESSIKRALAMSDRTQAMTELRALGFTHEEIGNYYDVSRQRVEQLVPGGDRAAAKNKEEVTPDILMRQIWEEATNDLSWWGPGGRLVKARIVDSFYERGYTWRRSRNFAREASISKIDVILQVSFGIEATHESKISWFKSQIEALSKAQILDLLNSGQLLQVPAHTFIRVWRELGLQVKVRKTRK